MDVKEPARKFLSIGILSGTMKSGISQRFTPPVKVWSWIFAYRFQLSASLHKDLNNKTLTHLSDRYLIDNAIEINKEQYSLNSVGI